MEVGLGDRGEGRVLSSTELQLCRRNMIIIFRDL